MMGLTSERYGKALAAVIADVLREVDIKEHGKHGGHVHVVYDTDGAPAPY